MTTLQHPLASSGPAPNGTPIAPIYDARLLPNRRQWTRADFAQLADDGHRYELIRGELVQKMPMNPPHAIVLFYLHNALARIFGLEKMVRMQMPLIASDSSQPEPDAAIADGPATDFLQSHPTTALLIVEVSDATLATDLGVKATLYAQIGVADYWVIDVNARLIHVHRAPIESASLPGGFGYQTLTRLTDKDTISPLAAPHASIAVADLLP